MDGASVPDQPAAKANRGGVRETQTNKQIKTAAGQTASYKDRNMAKTNKQTNKQANTWTVIHPRQQQQQQHPLCLRLGSGAETTGAKWRIRDLVASVICSLPNVEFLTNQGITHTHTDTHNVCLYCLYVKVQSGKCIGSP